MNRALFFISSIIVVILATDANPDFAGVDNTVSCPPCTYNCAYGFQCRCGHCVPITSYPGNVVVDCNHGYSFDHVQKRCVPVTCDASTACPAGHTCQPEQRSCTREPCPQYKCLKPACPSCATTLCPASSVCRCGTCQPIDVPNCLSCATVLCAADTQCKCGRCQPIERECGHGEEYDSRLGRCVAVTCSAGSACPLNQVCMPQRLDCVRTPCPQFECQPRPICASGEEYDPRFNRCAAVSCSARPCRWDELCVPQTSHCVRAPCPQFSCRPRFTYYAGARTEATATDD
jgi:hypothetical protein